MTALVSEIGRGEGWGGRKRNPHPNVKVAAPDCDNGYTILYIGAQDNEP